MPSAVYNKFDAFTDVLGRALHDLDANTIAVYLTNTTPLVSYAQKSQLAEIATGNGYAGPIPIPSKVWTASGGTAELQGLDIQITAAGGAIAQFQHVVMFDDTSVNDLLISWWSYPSPVDLADGETFNIDFGANIFSLT